MVGELPTAVLVAVADAAGDERFPRFVLDARLIERHRIDLDAEQEQLAGVEPLRLRAVEPAEDRVDLGLLLSLQPLPLGFELLGGFPPDPLDDGIVLGAELFPLLDEQSLEQGRIVGEVGDTGHVSRCTGPPKIAPDESSERRAIIPPQPARVATTVIPESSRRSWPLSIAITLSSLVGNRNAPRSSRL